MEQIEPLTKYHLDECASILVSAFNREPWNEHWSIETAKKDLFWTLNTAGFMGFVCKRQEILGFAVGYCEQSDVTQVFYLRNLCVKADFQGRGVGNRLMLYLKETLKEMGIKMVYLITYNDERLIDFYRKHGYRVRSENVVMIHEGWSRGE